MTTRAFPKFNVTIWKFGRFENHIVYADNATAAKKEAAYLYDIKYTNVVSAIDITEV